MTMSFRRAALPWIVALATVPVSVFAEDKPSIEPLHQITLDIDNDGKVDRAAIVQDTESEQADLYIYLAAGAEKLDLSHEPNLLKTDISEGSISGLESNGKGSLVITSCFGCGANESWAETLIIVHRGGEFLVAGYARDWDWNVHISDTHVQTTIGSCDIDFLTGKGVASQGLDEGKPIDGKFVAVKLADWSGDKRPEACNF